MSEFHAHQPDPRLAALLQDYPPGLFSDQLFQSIELVESYSVELTGDLLERLGVTDCLESWRSAQALCRDLGFVARFEPTLAWLLERMVPREEIMAREDGGVCVYRCQLRQRRSKLAALREIGIAADPAIRATLDLLDAAAEVYPAVARGQCDGEEALFGMGKISLWLAYFSNANPLYAVNNWVAAVAACRRLSDRRRLRILEVGAGGGSGTEALLEVLGEAGLADRIERYLITEPSPFFRRRCQRALKSRYRDVPLEFGYLDVDKSWEAQGAGPQAFDLVYGVNVLHVARDLTFSLAQARTTLAPGGWLVAGECMRPFADQAIYVELVFQILEGFSQVMTDPSCRPNPGFIMPEHWQRALALAGFGRVQISPDHARIRAIYPRFFVGALCAQERKLDNLCSSSAGERHSMI